VYLVFQYILSVPAVCQFLCIKDYDDDDDDDDVCGFLFVSHACEICAIVTGYIKGYIDLT